MSKVHLRVIANRPVSDKPHLRVVQQESKLDAAIKWLRSRNLYILDVGSKRPGWGVPGKGKA